MATYEKYLSMNSADLDIEIEKQKNKIHVAKTEIRLLKKLKLAIEASEKNETVHNPEPQEWQG